MLNEDKIKLMTELSFYEKKQKKQVYYAESFFKSDYVSKYMILGLFKYTVSFMLLFSVYMVYSMGDMENILHISDFISMFKQYGAVYIIGLFIYEILTWLVWSKRYEEARDVQGIYLVKLRRLQKRYEFQSKTKELSREDIGND